MRRETRGHVERTAEMLEVTNGSALSLVVSLSNHGSAPLSKVNFGGNCPCLVHLCSGAILCAYRDVSRPGISVSVSEDDGATWRWVGQLYSGANWDCAYPVIVRLPDGRLFCSYYTSFVDGDCEVRGMWLSDDL